MDIAARIKKFSEYVKNARMESVMRAQVASLLHKSVRDVDVVISGDLQPRTDGHTIYLSLLPDLLEEKWEPYWGVLLRPIAAHEVQHNNSSDFRDMKNIREWFAGELEKAGFDGDIGKKIASHIHNIVEDGRIESIAVKNHPGLLVPFQILNDSIRDGCRVEKQAADPEHELHDFISQLLSYSKTGLDAPGIAVYAGTELEKNFCAARGYIDAAIEAKTSYACMKQVRAMLTELIPYLSRLLTQSEDLRKKLAGEEPKDEYTGSGNSERNSGGGSPLRQNGSGKNGGNGEKSRKGAGRSAGFSNSGDESDSKPYTGQQLAEAKQAMDRAISEAKKRELQASSAASEQDSLSEDEVRKMLNQAYGEPHGELNILWPNLPVDPPAPDIQAEANILRRDLEKILKQKREPVYRQKQGYLDTGSLWRAGMGDTDVFYRPGRKDAGDTAFYMLIDNSGSMTDVTDSDMTKSAAARCAAAVIEEALYGIAPMKIALFNQEAGRANHTCLKPFETGTNRHACCNSIGEISPRGCNADSVNIRTAAEELAKRRERRKVLLILSDGTPSAYGSEQSGVSEVKQAVDGARKKGILVIPIMFGSESFRKELFGRYREMYTRDIVSCGPKEISRQLPALFRKLFSAA